jgi:hypothetical protein
LTGDINIETCLLVSLKYSVSFTSSMTTTLPSAGAITWLSLMVVNLLGLLKNCKISRYAITQNMMEIFCRFFDPGNK